jgi:putative CocE/NonD family hydrolase
MQRRGTSGLLPFVFLLLLVLVLPVKLASSANTAAPSNPETPEFSVKEHYTKYEYRIPMRDGVHLFTSIYVPKDSSQTYPFLINRTPYSVGPYGVDQYRKTLGPAPEFERAGYIFVNQDVRGRYMSEGTFVEMTPHIDHKKSNQDVDDASDLYDTIDWLLKNVPNNNGNAGIWGISYPGFYTSASIIDSHPALKAASPQAPMTDLFMGDDAYHGGAFMLAANFGFYVSFKPQENPQLPPKTFVPFDFGTQDGYEFYLNAGPLRNLSKYLAGKSALWDDQIHHDTYDDYWKTRNLAPHMKNIHCAVLTVGGWFDAEDLQGPFSTFHAIDKNNPGIFNALVVGPWVHGGWGRLDGDHLGRVEFAANTGEFYRRNILFPFFEQYLKGNGNGDARLPKAYVFETGTNVWRKYSAWPPKEAAPKTLYFHANGGLSFDPPAEETSFDEYVSDPAKPVPFVNYVDEDVPQEYMVSDQRFADSRTDVMVYQTPVLQEDVTIAGPISPRLFVSTSGTDSDFDVKLIDVYPPDYPDSKLDAPKPERGTPRSDVPAPAFVMGGYQQLVRGEPFRGKFRHSFEKPEPFTPGKVEEIDTTFQDVNHTFRRGHRIMVQIQSSWFPLTDRNPQTFVNIPDATPSDFVKATERIYHTKAEPSGIGVGVLASPGTAEVHK